MKKQKTEGKEQEFLRSFLIGAVGAALLTILLFGSAFLCNQFRFFASHTKMLGKACLIIATLFSGYAAAYCVKQMRLLHALAGEGGIFIIVSICSFAFSDTGNMISFLINLGIMLIGAFAGAISGVRITKQQRGKR